MLSNLVSAIRSNPIVNRHLTTTFTGPRLGGAFLLVGAALFFAYAVIFTELMYSTVPDGVIYVTHSGVLLGLLILLLPIKVTGIIEGARINKTFDQIVATGVAPSTLYWGAWFSGLAYAALLLFVTLPFAACLVTFSSADTWALVQSYAVLFVYSNVIIAVTLAASTFGRDWVSTPIAIALMSMLCVFSFVPDRDWVDYYPVILAELTPVRTIMESGVPDDTIFRAVMNSPPAVFLIWELPSWLVRIGLWTLVCVICAVLFSIGPGHVFRPGLDNFGAVVLKGDRKRGVMTWLRSGLARRVEMAFFYENAARWTARWGAPIRYALGALPFLVGAGLLIAALWATPRRGLPVTMQPASWYLTRDWKGWPALWVAGAMVALWALFTVNSRRNALAKRQVGGWKVTSETMFALCFLGLIGGVALIELIPIWNLQLPTTPMVPWRKGMPPPTVEGYVAEWYGHYFGMLLMVGNVFLLCRVASRVTQSVILARILALKFVAIWCGVPTLVYFLIMEGVLVEPSLAPLAAASPAMLVPQWQHGQIPVPGHGFDNYALAQGGLFVFLASLLSLRYIARLFRRGGAAAVTAVMLLGLAAAVPAQERDGPDDAPQQQTQARGPLKFKTLARGFDGVVFDNEVDFYLVEIENTSSATIRARYYVETQRENWGHGECVLSPKSSRTVRWNNAPGLASQRRYSRWGDTRVVVEGGGQRLRSKPLDLTHATSRSTRIANKGNVQTEQHLLVGKPGTFAQPWIDLAFASNSTNLAACEPRLLPLSPRSYSGVEIVWMTAAALVDMDRLQRQALHHYAMMGGTVLFHGALGDAELASAGVWGRLLKPVEQSITNVGDKQLRHVRLVEGFDLAIATERRGDPRTVANLRGLGAGFVGHVAFSPIRSQMPKDIASSQWFWKEFDRLIPRGGFPFVSGGVADDWIDSDYTMLAGLAGYYLVYALLISVGLFLFARRRSQRRRMWTMVFGLPVLFIGCVPLLVAAARSMPSLGEYTEIALFQAGSTEGVAVQHLRVHSAGRQSHELTFTGTTPRAYASTDRWRRYFVRQASMSRFAELSSKSVDGEFVADFPVAPWSAGELYLVDSKRLTEALTGRVESTRKGFTFRVQIPESLRGRRLFAVIQRNGAAVTRPLRVDGEGVGTAEVLAQGQNNNYYGNRLMLHRSFRFPARPKYGGTARTGTLVRAFVAVEPNEADLQMRPLASDDLGFEREVSERMAERSRRNRQGGRRRGISRRIRKAGSRYLEMLDHRLLMIEVPVGRK